MVTTGIPSSPDWLIGEHETAEVIIAQHRRETSEADEVLAVVHDAPQAPGAPEVLT